MNDGATGNDRTNGRDDSDALAPIDVRVHGSGERTVVVLHGGPGAPGSARGLAHALTPTFQVLEPLQRRAGLVPLTVARHVEDLAAVAPERASIVGWSWGAMLGLSYAACRPERVAGLVLVGCGTYDADSRAALRDALAHRLGPTARRRLDALRARLAVETDPARRDALLGEIGAAIMRAEAYMPLPDTACPLPADERGHAETWEDVLRLQRAGVEPERFRAITARVLMIHGDVDPHPGPATRDLLRRFVPALEYVELERCGHEPWRERHARERFRRVIEEWLLRTE